MVNAIFEMIDFEHHKLEFLHQMETFSNRNHNGLLSITYQYYDFLYNNEIIYNIN